jgi:hypothetical protein
MLLFAEDCKHFFESVRAPDMVDIFNGTSVPNLIVGGNRGATIEEQGNNNNLTLLTV